MNANQPGFMAGALLGGAAVGSIAGLIPLFFGVRKDKTWLAVGGFLASVAGGMVAGVIGAIVLMGIFSYVIVLAKEPAMEVSATPGGGPSQRSFVAWYIVTSFLVETIFLAVFWSGFMAVSLRRNFVAVLLPSGAAFGLTMGIFFTAFLAFLLRAGTVRIAVFDRADFLARLDRAAAKLRLRHVPSSEGAIVYEPKALIRAKAMRIFVDVGEQEAVLSGPAMSLQALKKEISKG